MRWKGVSKRDVDRLLRDAFRDDMPPEMEAQMCRRVGEMWQKASAASPARAGEEDSTASGGWSPGVPNLRPALLAVCAAAMVIFGGVLRLGHTSSFLVERFALKQTGFLVTARLEDARRMECRLRVRDGQGRVTSYSILWVEGRDSQVEMDGSAGRETGHASARPIQTRLVGAQTRTRENRTGDSQPRERWLESIREFLSAPAVAGLMTGRWQVDRGPDSGEKDRAAFLVTAPEKAGLARVVIDLRTYLPVSYTLIPADTEVRRPNSQPPVSAEFRWENRPASPGQHP